jgi:hypothetical protein
MSEFYMAHPMLVIVLAIVLMVLILGIMIPIVVYLSVKFIQWYLRRHPEKMLDSSSIEKQNAEFLFGDTNPVEDKGEDGFRL